MSHIERLKRHERMAHVRMAMNYYGCDEKEAWSFIPPEWAIYRERHGYACPAEERHIRFMTGKEGYP